MGRRRMLVTQGLDYFLGAGSISHGFDSSDKAAFLDDHFTFNGAGERLWHESSFEAWFGWMPNFTRLFRS